VSAVVVSILEYSCVTRIRRPAPGPYTVTQAEAPAASLVGVSEHAAGRHDAHQLTSPQHDVWSDFTYAVNEDEPSVSVPEPTPAFSSDPHQ
jgi:hypothetical protein